jgi:hypothetical protein
MQNAKPIVSGAQHLPVEGKLEAGSVSCTFPYEGREAKRKSQTLGFFR